jgi:hypothetical protein
MLEKYNSEIEIIDVPYTELISDRTDAEEDDRF